MITKKQEVFIYAWLPIECLFSALRFALFLLLMEVTMLVLIFGGKKDYSVLAQLKMLRLLQAAFSLANR